MKESKSTERTRMEEQLCDFFCLPLKCGLLLILFSFFFFLKLATFSNKFTSGGKNLIDFQRS